VFLIKLNFNIMKKMKHILFSISVLSIVFSCTKQIDFTADQIQEKIVVNSLFTEDSLWNAHISHSRSVLDNSPHNFLDNATVSVFDESNNLVTTLNHVSDGFYQSSTATPIANETYRLEVDAPGYNSVSATNSIPTEVPIINVDTISTEDSEGNPVLQVTMNFTDPGGVSNYYMLEMQYVLDYSQWGFDEEERGRLEITCNDPNIESVNSFSFLGEENAYNYLLLKDDQFDGQNYTLRFYVINWADFKEIDLTGEIRLMNTSEEFFNYRKSYEVYENAINNPFSQPVQVFSNIVGGMGVFAGGTLNVWSVVF
tara:strand:+ start:540 stop:1475 length:936 start_codon:yes stop_codon:yes gene_type:complete